MITNFRHSTRGEIIAAAALLAVLSIALLTNPPALLSQSGVEIDNTPAPARMIEDGAYLTGVVQDASGGALRGATVTVNSADTDIKRRTLSNNEGRYFFPFLQPGTYEVSAEAPGFSRATIHNMTLDPDTSSQLNFGLDAAGAERIPSRAPVRVHSAIQDSRLIHRVNPIYPQEAKDKRITGIVTLNVTIDEEGFVTDIADTGGPPELITAAIDAVRQWRYSPTTMNGVPVPVNAEVRVPFALY